MALTKASLIDLNGQELILDADADTSITADTDDQIDFKTAGSDRVTINASGSLLIGNTDGSGIVNVNNGSGDGGYVHFANNVGATTLTNNQGLAFGWNKSNGGGESVIIANQGAGTSGGLVFATNTSAGSYTERMRIDSSGHLLVGTTSEYSGTSGNITAARQIDIGANDTNAKTLFFNRNAAVGEIGGIAGGVTGFSTMGRISFNAENVSGGSQSSSIRFKTTLNATESERMRIESGGNVLLNQTATADSGVSDGRLEITRGSQHCINCHVAGTGNSTLVAFINDNGFVGGINTNGSNTVYNTSSDARLKNVLGEAKGLEIINALNPVNFEWKSDGKIQDGLIAQEVEEVFPQAVSEPELDGEWYSVDYSRFVTPLIKAMQEQQEQIEALQSEINTLKGG